MSLFDLFSAAFLIYWALQIANFFRDKYMKHKNKQEPLPNSYQYNELLITFTDKTIGITNGDNSILILRKDLSRLSQTTKETNENQ
jgi:hypothetical protein